MAARILPVMVLLAATACGDGLATPPDEPHALARAILAARCGECHGPDAAESNLRLDSRAGLLAGGDFGPVVVPGQPARSELIRRVATTNVEQRMPPDGERLSADEVAALAAWIDAGTPWPGSVAVEAASDPRLDHWAWQPIVKPPVPDAEARFAALPGVEEDRNPIDRFIRATLAGKQLSPSPTADRRVLIRRLFFDLTGLPPAPEEVEAFVADPDPQAYDRLVDRLLASPRYGERWARHWLDVVHYGDTHGYDKDQPRPNAWPYRDYVIRALNADKPYGRFVSEQVAGDVLWPGTRDGEEAIGFLAAGPWDLIGHREVPETKTDGKIARHLDRDDMVANTIGTFASVTVHCAQCHAHKFDPVTQDDYYALQAVFAALDRDDRRYATDHEGKRRSDALQARKAAAEARRRELQAAIGPRLAAVEQELAKAGSAEVGNTGPAYGYHAAISPVPVAEKWVQIDLGAERRIRDIVLRPCHDTFNGIGAGFGFPVRYRVEVSNDPAFGAGIATVAAFEATDVPNPGVAPQTLPAGTSGRYLRVTATKLAARKNDFIFALAEIEALTPEGENAARGRAVTSLDSIEAAPRWRRANVVDGEAPRGPQESRQRLEAERAELLAQAGAERAAEYGRVVAELEAVEAEQRSLPPLQVAYSVTAALRGGKPRPIHVLARGNVNAPTREMGPGTLGLVAALPARFDLPADHAEGDRRAALARWLVDPGNPLTWRSIVNRVWQYHFGRGVVATPSDFGRMGAAPTHPALLDWLAAEFRDGGGSLKALHRLIVTSATYRQSSAVRPECAAVDGEATLLWRQHRRRLEAEAIRDAVLAAAGTLDLAMGGPGWQDFAIEHPQHSPHYRYDLADPEDRGTWRRGVYRFVVRSQTQPFMTCLDCADPSMRVEKRNESISAPQALALLNNGFMLVQSQRFADRLAREAGADPTAQVDQAFRLALGRSPDAEERAMVVELVVAHGLANACRTILNLNEFSFVD